MPTAEPSRKRSRQPVPGDGSGPFVQLSRTISPGAYSNCSVTYRDYVHPGETHEEAMSRLSTLADSELRRQAERAVDWRKFPDGPGLIEQPA